MHQKVGGGFRPVIWPEVNDSIPHDPLVRTVYFNGDPWNFLVHASPVTGSIPSVESLHAEMLKRNVDDGQSAALAQHEQCSKPLPEFQMEVFPSPDGTRFLLHTWWNSDTWYVDYKYPEGICRKGKIEHRWVILDGPNTVWCRIPSTLGPRVTYFGNRWNDLVSVTETGGNEGGNPITILIQNERYTTQKITLDRSSGNLVVTNTLGLYTASLFGTYKTLDLTTTGCANSLLLAYFGGFIPDRLEEGAGGELRTTGFAWWQGMQPTIYSLSTIEHSSGLKEIFYFNKSMRLSSGCFDPPLMSTLPLGQDCNWVSNGKWSGFRPWSYFDHMGYRADDTYEPVCQGSNPAADSVDRVVTEMPDGTGKTVLIVREQPTAKATSSYTSLMGPGVPDDIAYAETFRWQKRDHTTTVLHLPSPIRTGYPSTVLYRGVRLIHPSASLEKNPYRWGSPDTPIEEQRAAYLFAISAVVAEEEISGTQLNSTSGQPTDRVVSRTTIHDGWDLRSWANPTGSLTIGLPINSVPTRTQVFETPLGTGKLPARTTLASNWNGRGFSQVDEFVQAPPQSIPNVSGSTPAMWSESISAPAGAEIHRKNESTLTWDASLFEWVSGTTQKTLDGTQLNTLRGVTAVALGKTTLTPDALGRLNEIKGERSGLTALDTRTFFDGKPQVKTIRKSIQGVTIAQPELTVGQDFAFFLGTPHEGLQKETNYPDGRSTIYLRDELGRETQVTDPNGLSVTTTYDAWGRIWTKTGGGLVTTFTYDPNGRWMESSVVGGGRPALVTRTDYDAMGRVVSVTLPGKSPQITVYDGFGQKTDQSPLVRLGVTSWGNNHWDYDAIGRLTTTKDARGRVLTTVTGQPSWGTLAGESRPGVLTTATDDRGFSRSELIDLLGQKIAVLDQKGQLTRYFYDGDGHLKGTDQGGQTRSYTYNNLGWLLDRTEPEEGQTVFSGHTLLGSPLTSIQKGRLGTSSVSTTTVLNSWGLPRSVTQSGPQGTFTRTIQDGDYNATTHLPMKMTETQPNGTLVETYGYDALARLNHRTISDGSPQSFAIHREMDAFGNVTSLTYPAGGGRAEQIVTYGVDDLNRPSSVVLGSDVRGQMNYGTPNGNAVTDTLVYGNFASTESKIDMGELVKVTHRVVSGLNDPNQPANQQINYMGWSPGGLLNWRGPDESNSNGTNDSFTYDELQRLTASTVWGLKPGEKMSQTYGYDRWGNRTSNGSTYAAGTGGIRPEEVLAWTATYDSRNSLGLTVTGANGLSLGTGVVYDDLGRLTAVEAVPNNVGAHTTLWGYDPSGRVVTEKVKGITSSFLLDGGGRRFRRVTDTGKTVYTVYGFNGEPLIFFETTAAQGVRASMASASSKKTTTQSVAVLPPVGAYIDAPAAGTTLLTGRPVVFAGHSDDGVAFSWNFGDGTTATGASPTKTFATAGTYTVRLTVAATPDYKASTASRQYVVAVAPPTITSFLASPTSILSGQNATLSWAATGATSLSINGSTVTGTSLVVHPTSSTTYTLTATNAGGSVTASVTVGVNAAAPVIQSFGATPTTLTRGQSTTLNWATANAISVSLNGNVVTGTSLVVSPTSNTTYTLTVTNGTGSATSSITVTVNTPPPVISSFSASEGSITPGQSTTLNWAVSDATSLSLSGIGPVTGTSLVVTPNATTTYTLTASGMGSVTSTVTVTVQALPALTWVKTLVYGFGTLLSEEKASDTFYMQGDQVGSPSILTDRLGAVMGRSKNLPFGERFGQIGEKSTRRYTNHEDQEGSAIYMQARTYLPAYGKFAQVDPAYDQMKDDPETWNLYNYVTNNPVTHTDPDGRRVDYDWGPNGPPAWYAGGLAFFLFGAGAETTAISAGAGYYEIVEHAPIVYYFLNENVVPNAGSVSSQGIGGNFLTLAIAAVAMGALPQSQVKLIFETLWKNHPTIDGSSPVLDRETYANQCAIALSAALLKSGVSLSSFKGVKSWEQGKPEYAIRAQELADWLVSNKSRFGLSVTKHSGNDAFEAMSGKKGIVFIQNYYGPGNQGDHIDLWNGSRMTDWTSYFRVNWSFRQSNLYSAQSVWFMEMK